ncbi:alpha-glucan family phosphorylase [Altericroceibacterium xinjiangense]|uniref:alpha-glucan family phosphorylase n=1 Tax=Altericroceibacterium xinjiangense TaxID=762261 RepID=UPI001F496F92|nr:alpha-glucan family phosphorylase [Altericroceibacterium xinjiangense]
MTDCLKSASIAFVTMEIALEPGMRCYSGGLGVLAGDYALAAADIGLPMVFVTLASREGYVRQGIDAQGHQIDVPDPWDLEKWAKPLDPVVRIVLEGRQVAVRAWVHELQGEGGARIPTLLLDTDLPENSAEDRKLTGRLYGGDERYRLLQEAVLGMATSHILKALGCTIATFHLNEGHAALLPVELVRKGASVDEARDRCVFTTHTPVAAGRDRFPLSLAERVLGPQTRGLLERLVPGEPELDMTLLALGMSRYSNAVSCRHAETAQEMYPGVTIHAVTNGVHLGRWTAPAMADVFDRDAPGWRTDPDCLRRIAGIEPEEVAKAHGKARTHLIGEVERLSGIALDPDAPILCYARRMTGYKRPALLFHDLERLLEIAERQPFSVLVAGKAHPKDDTGHAEIARIHQAARDSRGRLSVVFLPGYGLELAAKLVAGTDVWLNVPIPPLEASGTSGMKAAVNGVLNLSTRDGWWLEGYREGRNGWAIGQEGGDPDEHGPLLLEMLEKQVLPEWYEHRDRWHCMMRDAVATVGPRFSAIRPMHEYAAEAYRLPAG